MADISYTIEGIENTFLCDLPESFQCRLDWNSYQLIDTSLDADFHENHPKDMYHFMEFNSLDDALFSFMALYRDSLIGATDELDLIYDELITYYDPHVYKNEGGAVIFEAFYSDPIIINGEELEDYVPPVVEEEEPPLEGALGDQVIEVPPVDPAERDAAEE